MKKKLKSKSGLTLVEMMVSLMILVLLVVGMGPGMDVASRIYKDSTFESDSAMLARIVNNTMGDVLRYAESVDDDYDGKPLPDGIPFVFTSYDYRIQDGYFTVAEKINEGDRYVIQMKNMRNGTVMDLVNRGAYPDLEITDLEITANTARNMFVIEYKISSMSDAGKVRDVDYVVRSLKH